MRASLNSIRPRGLGAEGLNDLAARLRRRIVGQTEAIDEIVPYVELFEAGLAPAGRPAGVFLLLGPTGTGKTRTVEALAETLHGSERHVLRIDCGEFQLEHEVAKLIGAPPGYLGHRETQPMVSQQKLNAVASERSGLSIVLLDEIEKAAPSMTRLLLGVLDKASLKLGDNTTVNFERSLIFMTSNLGARAMMAEVQDRFGLAAALPRGASSKALRSLGLAAVRKRFSPEFVNRVDAILTYQPLDRAAVEQILDLQLEVLARHIDTRLGPAGFRLSLTWAAREFLIERGTSSEYGARELKRVIHRHLIQPLARLVLDQAAEPGEMLTVDVGPDGNSLRFAPKFEDACAA
ncbi:AAA family ATPase [uncultured Paludibaculum sp.]|uniref:AAA family ATPase n=1 Tax=uncultured Paludibaculum sp. TaxID=1765020 RepID=UPI002AAA6D9C|nr:AAA family ATPase [uncultured Paludibaculum sp.]